MALHELPRRHDLDSLKTRGPQERSILGDDEARTACKRAPQKLEVIGVVAGGRAYGRGFHNACLPGDQIEDGVDVNRWKPLVQAFGNTTVLGEDINAGNQLELAVGPGCQDPRGKPGEKDP